MISRIVFSLGIGFAIFAVLLFILAFAVETSELDYGVAMLGAAIALTLWGAILLQIWKGKRTTLAWILTSAGLLVTWLVTIALCFFWHAVNLRAQGLFIGGTVLAGMAGSIGLILFAVRSASAGDSSRKRAQMTTVRCPSCRYAMNGLRECTCPECGRRFTIDELFAAQR